MYVSEQGSCRRPTSEHEQAAPKSRSNRYCRYGEGQDRMICISMERWRLKKRDGRYEARAR